MKFKTDWLLLLQFPVLITIVGCWYLGWNPEIPHYVWWRIAMWFAVAEFLGALVTVGLRDQ